jgi:hypothetical protein
LGDRGCICNVGVRGIVGVETGLRVGVDGIMVAAGELEEEKLFVKLRKIIKMVKRTPSTNNVFAVLLELLLSASF